MIQLTKSQKGLFPEFMPDMILMDREQLARLLFSILKNMTLDEFTSLFANKFTETIEYIKLCNGEPFGNKISLLFNPHRLDTCSGMSRKNSIYSSLQDFSFVSGISRVLILKHPKTLINNLLYRCLQIGINGRVFVHEIPPFSIRKMALNFKLNLQSKILGPCGGWGGEMIGFSTISNHYECCEPSTKTYEGLLKLADFIKNILPEFNPIIHCLPFEDFENKNNHYDFAFTSPPYYDTEYYSDEETNSCNRYKTFENWTNNFYIPLIQKTMNSLKTGCYFVLNIGSRKYPLSTILIDNFKNQYDINKLSTIFVNNKGLGKKGEGENFYSIKKI